MDRTVEVPYRTPRERARAVAARTAANAALAWLLVVLPLLVAYLQAGDFSRGATVALATSGAVASLTALLAWLRHYLAARGEG